MEPLTVFTAIKVLMVLMLIKLILPPHNSKIKFLVAVLVAPSLKTNYSFLRMVNYQEEPNLHYLTQEKMGHYYPPQKPSNWNAACLTL